MLNYQRVFQLFVLTSTFQWACTSNSASSLGKDLWLFDVIQISSHQLLLRQVETSRELRRLQEMSGAQQRAHDPWHVASRCRCFRSRALPRSSRRTDWWILGEKKPERQAKDRVRSLFAFSIPLYTGLTNLTTSRAFTWWKNDGDA